MVVIVQNDLRGSKAQVDWTVSRTNNTTDKDVIFSSPSHWRYQLAMADFVPAEYFMILLTGIGYDVFVDPYFPDNRNNVHSINGLIEVPHNIDFAIVHERYQYLDTIENVAKNMGFPTIYVEHKMPKPGYQLDKMKERLKDCTVVFRSEECRDAWGYDKNEAHVIYDGYVINRRKREPGSDLWLTIHDHIDLTGHKLWTRVRQRGPFELRGHNGCYAYETTEAQENSLYESYKGYVNFNIEDPFPLQVGRAIANGLPIISVPNDFLKRQFGDSIIFVETAEDLVESCKMDLSSKGLEARDKLQKNFNYSQFQKSWKALLEEVRYD